MNRRARAMLDRVPLAPGQLVVGAFALFIAGWLVVGTVRRVHFGPVAELRAEIAEERAAVAARERVIADAPRVRRRLDDLVARTLGGTVEEVDHRLRTRLNRIAESVGLADASVGTGNASPRRSPARSRFARSMRDEIDFVELEGWIAGTGDFVQIVRLIDALDAEPWTKRLVQVRLDPRDNGARFKASVRLVTVFLPRRGPAELAAAPYDPARLEPFATLVAANPFQVPAPVVEKPPATPSPPGPPPKPPFPWDQWALTGIAEGPRGGEAWLLNRTSGEARRLGVGSAIDEAVLHFAAGDWAEFGAGDRRFRVRVGTNLSDRTPVPE